MRLSTIFVSTVFMLAGARAALPVERRNMLVTRFVDSDFIADVEARAYDKVPELFARGRRDYTTVTGGSGSRGPNSRTSQSSGPSTSTGSSGFINKIRSIFPKSKDSTHIQGTHAGSSSNAGSPSNAGGSGTHHNGDDQLSDDDSDTKTLV